MTGLTKTERLIPLSIVPRFPHLSRSMLCASVLFALTFALYLHQLPPSITWSHAGSDSGDFATAVATWGVPHPPGYPTYLLMGRLIALLPVGDVAYRLNLLSALSGAGAVSLLFLASLRLLRLGPGPRPEGARPSWQSLLASAVGAVALALSPILWGQAVVAEVYTVAALFCSGILLLCASSLANPRPRWKLPLVALLIALGLGVHYTVGLFALPLFVVVASRGRTVLRKTWPLCSGAILAGLATFAYLPFAAGRNPPINWGYPADWAGFWWSVSAAPYRALPFGIPSGLIADRLGDWGKSMVDNLQGVGVVVALFGFWRLWTRDRGLAAAIAVAVLGISAYATFYYTADSFVFLLPAILLGCVLVAFGAAYGFERLARLRSAPLALGAALVLLVPGVSLLRNYGGMDLSYDTEALDYGRRALGAVEPTAIVLADVDRPLFALWYARYALDPEPTPRVIARNLLQFEWYRRSEEQRTPGIMAPASGSSVFRDTLLGFVARNIERRPVYSTFLDPDLINAYDLKPSGKLYRITPKAQPAPS